MLHFHRVCLQDRDWMNHLIRKENSRSTDHCFSNIYMWDKSYLQEVTEAAGCLCIRLNYQESPFYAFPVGSGDRRAAIRLLQEDAAALGLPLRIRGICRTDLDWLAAEFQDAYTLTEDRFVYDYVYLAEKLASLSGKKLQQKRNHIHRFEEHCPDWTFQSITAQNLSACREFQRSWLELHLADSDEQGELLSEDLAIRRCFDHWDTLGLEGGILSAGGRMIAFTVGEQLNSDTYDVHFEKALPDIQGAYPMINREFVRSITAQHPEVIYINREDDMGRENLRRAKLSYAPEMMIEKYTAQWKQ